MRCSNNDGKLGFNKIIVSNKVLTSGKNYSPMLETLINSNRTNSSALFILCDDCLSQLQSDNPSLSFDGGMLRLSASTH